MKKIIGRDDELFPKMLNEISDCPGKIYGVGNLDLLKSKKIIAVVGSRNMSQYGRSVIRYLVPKLVEEGWVIVSGMAYGVDSEVHKICLENKGKTIAVLASGADVVSPKGNSEIYKKIIEDEGLIISEREFGKNLEDKNDFLKRNRIVAGLGVGVIVVEGGIHSGCLVTARLAAEEGREVWAVPGRITDPTSVATNWLIKNGASIVINTQEIGLK